MLGVEERFEAPARFSAALAQLHELAAREAGAEDFGPPDYLIGLRVLLESMDYDPQFSPRGRNIAWGAVVTTLSSRAIAMRGIKDTPGQGGVAIDRPVIITGLHRTGTTALHQLLSLDPRFQGLQGWLAAAPMPRPPRSRWPENPHFRQAVKRLEARFAGAPGLRAAHDMAAGQVDECGGVLFHSFNSLVWSSAWSASSYEAWRLSQYPRAAYGYFRDVLRLIGSSEPDKRWLLKHPPHLAHLDLVFELFPDARVIQTHRDPGLAIPSLCSLVMASHDLMEIGRKDQRARLMGLRETARAAKVLRDAEAVRRARADQVIDVRHADFHRDPMGTLETIYRFIGMELTDDVRPLLQERIDGKPELQHGVHRYTIADYGMTEEEAREPFGDYIQRFDLVQS